MTCQIMKRWGRHLNVHDWVKQVILKSEQSHIRCMYPIIYLEYKEKCAEAYKSVLLGSGGTTG